MGRGLRKQNINKSRKKILEKIVLRNKRQSNYG